MGGPIHDEFSDLPLSRQMKYYLRQRRDRRCTKCGKPVEAGSLCLEHMVQTREHRRRTVGNKRRNRGSLSYRVQEQQATTLALGTLKRARLGPTIPGPGLNLELEVPADHPLRATKQRVDRLLKKCAAALGTLDRGERHPDFPPAILLKSWVLMNLFAVRTTKLFCDQLGYNLLWLWFLDRSLSQGGFDPEVFARAYDQVLQSYAARQFFRELIMSGEVVG